MERDMIVWVTGDGQMFCKGDYGDAVERLCRLEEKYQPGERYTVRRKDGKAFPRRGIELVLGRLYYYERKADENDRCADGV